MIVKDSTTNQVHNDSTQKKKPTIKKIKIRCFRVRSARTNTSCRKDLADTRQTRVSATHTPSPRRGLAFLILFFGHVIFQKQTKKKNCNNKKEDFGEFFLFPSKHDKHYIQSW